MTASCYLVTGGSSGTGKAVAKLLAEQGHTVIIWGTNEEKLRRAVTEQAASSYAVVDVSDPDQVAQGFRTILAKYQLAGVVHAAGTWTPGKLTELDPSTIRQHIATVTNGTVWVAREAVKAMQTTGGSIVLIAAASAMHGFTDTALNTLAKRAIDGLQEALAKEIAETAIKLTTIYPNSIGPADSEAVSQGKAMAYEDVASAIIFAINAPRTTQVREMLLIAAKTGK